jgi:hypothetical protein
MRTGNFRPEWVGVLRDLHFETRATLLAVTGAGSVVSELRWPLTRTTTVYENVNLPKRRSVPRRFFE